MSLIKRKQNDKAVENLKSGFDSLIDSFFDDFPFGFASNSNLIETSFKPKVNISEDKKSYLVDIELAGVKKEDVQIEYDNYSFVCTNITGDVFCNNEPIPNGFRLPQSGVGISVRN